MFLAAAWGSVAARDGSSSPLFSPPSSHATPSASSVSFLASSSWRSGAQASKQAPSWPLHFHRRKKVDRRTERRRQDVRYGGGRQVGSGIPPIGQPADNAAVTGKIRRPAPARLRTGGPSLPVPVRVQKPASRSRPQPRAAAFARWRSETAPTGDGTRRRAR